MPDRLFEDEAREPDAEWSQRSVRSLSDELRRRRRRLERRNPLEDRAAYLEEFRALVALQAHVRDRGD